MLKKFIFLASLRIAYNQGGSTLCTYTQFSAASKMSFFPLCKRGTMPRSTSKVTQEVRPQYLRTCFYLKSAGICDCCCRYLRWHLQVPAPCIPNGLQCHSMQAVCIVVCRPKYSGTQAGVPEYLGLRTRVLPPEYYYKRGGSYYFRMCAVGYYA